MSLGGFGPLAFVLRCARKFDEPPVIHGPARTGRRESNDAAFSGEDLTAVQELSAALPRLKEP